MDWCNLPYIVMATSLPVNKAYGFNMLIKHLHAISSSLKMIDLCLFKFHKLGLSLERQSSFLFPNSLSTLSDLNHLKAVKFAELIKSLVDGITVNTPSYDSFSTQGKIKAYAHVLADAMDKMFRSTHIKSTCSKLTKIIVDHNLDPAKQNHFFIKRNFNDRYYGKEEAFYKDMDLFNRLTIIRRALDFILESRWLPVASHDTETSWIDAEFLQIHREPLPTLHFDRFLKNRIFHNKIESSKEEIFNIPKMLSDSIYTFPNSSIKSPIHHASGPLIGTLFGTFNRLRGFSPKIHNLIKSKVDGYNHRYHCNSFLVEHEDIAMYSSYVLVNMQNIILNIEVFTKLIDSYYDIPTLNKTPRIKTSIQKDITTYCHNEANTSIRYLFEYIKNVTKSHLDFREFDTISRIIAMGKNHAAIYDRPALTDEQIASSHHDPIFFNLLDQSSSPFSYDNAIPREPFFIQDQHGKLVMSLAYDPDFYPYIRGPKSSFPAYENYNPNCKNDAINHGIIDIIKLADANLDIEKTTLNVNFTGNRDILVPEGVFHISDSAKMLIRHISEIVNESSACRSFLSSEDMSREAKSDLFYSLSSGSNSEDQELKDDRINRMAFSSLTHVALQYHSNYNIKYLKCYNTNCTNHYPKMTSKIIKKSKKSDRSLQEIECPFT